jgi:hypothetical protein
MTTGSAAGRAARSSALVQIAAPHDFPAQAPDPRLTTGLDKQPQGTVYNGALGAFTGGAHRFPHQAIIDIDVRAHLMPPCVRIADSCVFVNAQQMRWLASPNWRAGDQAEQLGAACMAPWHGTTRKLLNASGFWLRNFAF